MKNKIYIYIIKKDMKKFYTDVIQQKYRNFYLTFQNSSNSLNMYIKIHLSNFLRDGPT